MDREPGYSSSRQGNVGHSLTAPSSVPDTKVRPSGLKARSPPPPNWQDALGLCEQHFRRGLFNGSGDIFPTGIDLFPGPNCASVFGSLFALIFPFFSAAVLVADAFFDSDRLEVIAGGFGACEGLDTECEITARMIAKLNGRSWGRFGSPPSSPGTA